MNIAVRTEQASPIDYTSYLGDQRLEVRGNGIAASQSPGLRCGSQPVRTRGGFEKTGRHRHQYSASYFGCVHRVAPCRRGGECRSSPLSL